MDCETPMSKDPTFPHPYGNICGTDADPVYDLLTLLELDFTFYTEFRL